MDDGKEGMEVLPVAVKIVLGPRVMDSQMAGLSYCQASWVC